MRLPPVYTFHEVGISVPSKISDSEDEWQEVNWVPLDTCDLVLDGDSFLLVVKFPGKSVKAKSLGTMIKAAAVAAEGGSTTMIVTTSDQLHRHCRLVFRSIKEANEFAQLARTAETAHNQMMKQKATKHTANPSKEAVRLEKEIQDKLGDRLPLVFAGVELYGPDGGGEPEVLIGRGAAVLLDPREDQKQVGSYELVFYGEDEGVRSPLKSFAIGPKTLAKKVQPDADADEDEGPAATFRIAVPGQQDHAITFDDVAAAAAFARDFKVRHRLMSMALRTSQGAKTESQLREEIQGMKQHSFGARLRNAFWLLVLIAFVAVLLRLAMLYQQSKGSMTVSEYGEALVQDVLFTVRGIRSTTVGLGGKVCETAFGSVRSEDLRRCTAFSKASEIRSCIQMLAGP